MKLQPVVPGQTVQNSLSNVYSNNSITLYPRSNEMSFTNCFFFDLTLEVRTPNLKLVFTNCSIKKLTVLDSMQVGEIVFLDSTLETFEAAHVNGVKISSGKPPAKAAEATFTVADGELSLKLDDVKELHIENCSAKEVKLISAYNSVFKNAKVRFLDFTNCNAVTVQDKSKITEAIVNGEKTNSFLIQDSECSTLRVNTNIVSFQSKLSNLGDVIKSKGNLISISIFGSKVRTFSTIGSEPFFQHTNSIEMGACWNERGELINTSLFFFKIKGPIEAGKFTFTDTKIEHLLFEGRLQSPQAIEFDNVTVDKLSFKNAEISENVSFTRFKFNSSSNELVIFNSNIVKGHFSTVQWMRDFRLSHNKENYAENLSDEDFLWNLREGYRQLKTLSAQSQNKLEAVEFLANELDTHYEIVKQRWLKNKFSIELGNFLVLWTNKHFSSYGNDVIKPLGLLLLSTFLFMQPLLCDLNIEWSANPNLDTTKTAIGYYLTLISPVHPFEINIGKTNPANIMGIADFFLRVFNAYFLFYFIRATRKYHIGL